MKGIDISHWQGKSFFNKLHSLQKQIGADIEFVIMKATEGRTYADPMFHEYMKEVKDRNLLAGAYHFARPDNGNSAEEEAANFVTTIRPYLNDALLLALDWEGEAAKKSSEDWVLAWCNTVYDLTGIKPLVYCSISNVNRLPSVAAKNYGLWVARWTSAGTPGIIAPWKIWAIWQYTNTPVDIDIFNGNKIQWLKYCTASKKPVVTPEEGTCHCGCDYCCDNKQEQSI